jgi:hypothetical protein
LASESDLTVDLSDLTFADPSLMLDLAMVARRLRKASHVMTVRGAQPQIHRLIEMVGLNRLPSVASKRLLRPEQFVTCCASGRCPGMRALTMAVVLGGCAVIPGATLALRRRPPPPATPTAATFGHAVALSGNGTTAIVGAVRDDHRRGAAYVFVRSGVRWRQQGPSSLAHKGAVHEPLMGQSVAISADGNTALVGGDLPDPAHPTNDGGVLGALIFARHTTGGCDVATLIDTRERQRPRHRCDDAVGRRNTAIVGDDEGGSDGAGAAFVFTRHHGTWSTHGRGAAPSPRDERVRGLRPRGRVVGRREHRRRRRQGRRLRAGAVRVYRRHNDIWTRGHADRPRGSSTGSFAGSAVAVSANGDTVLIGGYFDRDLFGSAWVYTRRPNGAWVQLGHKLHPAATKREAAFGEAVALSGDGRTAVIGGLYDDINRGAVWVFKLHGSDFVQQGTPRRQPGRGFLRFGRSVAVSQNGRLAMAGTPTHSHNVGCVAVFRP